MFLSLGDLLVLSHLTVPFLLCAGLGAYLLPTLVSWMRHHPHTASIGILNLLLGWTLLGWVGAMVWAASARPTDATAP
jgi:hypothetical protein